MARVAISFASETEASFELASETIAGASQALNERLTELIQDISSEAISSKESLEDEELEEEDVEDVEE